MAKKIKLDDKEYDASNLSDQGKAALVSFQFTTNRLNELITCTLSYNAPKIVISIALNRKFSRKSGIPT